MSSDGLAQELACKLACGYLLCIDKEDTDQSDIKDKAEGKDRDTDQSNRDNYKGPKHSSKDISPEQPKKTQKVADNREEKISTK